MARYDYPIYSGSTPTTALDPFWKSPQRVMFQGMQVEVDGVVVECRISSMFDAARDLVLWRAVFTLGGESIAVGATTERGENPREGYAKLRANVAAVIAGRMQPTLKASAATLTNATGLDSGTWGDPGPPPAEKPAEPELKPIWGREIDL
jgi:hypothetical protein